MHITFDGKKVRQATDDQRKKAERTFMLDGVSEPRDGICIISWLDELGFSIETRLRANHPAIKQFLKLVKDEPHVRLVPTKWVT